jgi:hypothetical protein
MAVHVDIFPMVISSIRIAAVAILTVGEGGACRQKQ